MAVIFNEDMCIKEAVIVFEHFKIEKIVFSAHETYDSNQDLIESVEATTANSEEYVNILKNTLNTYCYIFSMDELPKLNDNNLVCFTINGADIYDLTLSFSQSIIQWDEYDGKAWYENEEWKKK